MRNSIEYRGFVIIQALEHVWVDYSGQYVFCNTVSDAQEFVDTLLESRKAA